MKCSQGHKMELEEVEVMHAYQRGGEIVDAEYEAMWVCTNMFCQELKEME